MGNNARPREGESGGHVWMATHPGATTQAVYDSDCQHGEEMPGANPMTNLGQLLHTLLHDISPWGWKMENKYAFCVIRGAGQEHIADTGCWLDNERKEMIANAAFIAASPATVGRLIKEMVEKQMRFFDGKLLHVFTIDQVLCDLGISRGDWKLLLERLGEE